MSGVTYTVYSKLNRMFGKDFEVSRDVPAGLLLGVMFSKMFCLLRGLLVFRKKVFLGERVKIRGKRGIHLGKFVTVEPYCSLDGYGLSPVKMGDRTKLGAYSRVSVTSHVSKVGKGFSIGSDCGVSEFCFFGASGGIEIGNDVIMGQYVSFHSENHLSESGQLIRKQGVTSEGIVVGNDVWIGAKATLLDGTRVGDHCVIAAGSVVSGNFPNNVVIAGVPAKIIREI